MLSPDAAVPPAPPVVAVSDWQGSVAGFSPREQA